MPFEETLVMPRTYFLAALLTLTAFGLQAAEHPKKKKLNTIHLAETTICVDPEWIIASHNPGEEWGGLRRTAMVEFVIPPPDGILETSKKKRLAYIYLNTSTSVGAKALDQMLEGSTSIKRQASRWSYSFEKLQIDSEKTAFFLTAHTQTSKDTTFLVRFGYKARPEQDSPTEDEIDEIIRYTTLASFLTEPGTRNSHKGTTKRCARRGGGTGKRNGTSTPAAR